MKDNLIGSFYFIVFLFIIPGFLLSEITKGPYLNKPQKNSMTIMWECDNDNPVILSYWENDNDKKEETVHFFDSRDSLFLYRLKLKELQPAQKYYYKVITEDGCSVESWFYTNPLKREKFNFIVIGDTRTGHKVFSTIMNKVENYSPRFIINMGDLVNRGKNFNEWPISYFDPAKSVINHIPLISTLGDHETAGGYNGYNFYYYFRNGINTDSMWFSYDMGDIHFISLDYRRENDEGMITWFKDDLKNCKSKWKIVYLHRPSYNLGGHRSHWGSPIWQELFRDYKIDIVFAGHSHLYERFYPMRPSEDKKSWPVTFITTGGAGAELYQSVTSDYLAVTKSVNHFMVGSVSGDTLKFIVKLLDGGILDSFVMVKHNGQYDPAYHKLVKDQEVMDIYMAFASRLLIKFNELPSIKTPAKRIVKFDTDGLTQDVPFKMFLTKESSKYYRIEPFEGVLKKNKDFQGTVVLYTKSDVKINGIYFIPPVIFNLSFKYGDKEILVKGRECRYYPPKNNTDYK